MFFFAQNHGERIGNAASIYYYAPNSIYTPASEIEYTDSYDLNTAHCYSWIFGLEFLRPADDLSNDSSITITFNGNTSEGTITRTIKKSDWILCKRSDQWTKRVYYFNVNGVAFRSLGTSVNITSATLNIAGSTSYKYNTAVVCTNNLSPNMVPVLFDYQIDTRRLNSNSNDPEIDFRTSLYCETAHNPMTIASAEATLDMSDADPVRFQDYSMMVVPRSELSSHNWKLLVEAAYREDQYRNDISSITLEENHTIWQMVGSTLTRFVKPNKASTSITYPIDSRSYTSIVDTSRYSTFDYTEQNQRYIHVRTYISGIQTNR